ncbi:hypothetical protein M378DRAFT_970539 [Amanita muscaria Koide BX008]|uniref:Uncharacterized protein n=1 Tax=Amanita muscaria (strain Koide BX008) TaxID=946122 RepID=A0A0C2T002_AMAMK|nr:hypothetical protein M378DRAFT_970539 [Amanita muscaria Koide BX008]
MNEGRNLSPADSRPPRSTLPDMAVDGTRRPGLGTPTRLYGSIDGLDEPRPDPFSFEGDHIFEPNYPPPRRVASLSRPPTLPSAWAEHAPRRPASPPHPQLGRSNTTSVQHIRDRDEPERFSRFLDYIHDYRDSSLYAPPPFDFAVPSTSPPRVQEEPSPGHRIRSETHTESWFSRRRHLSSRSSSQPHGVHAETWIDLAAEYAAERSPTESARTAGAGFGPRVGSTRQADREPSFAELRASYERNTTRADETSRLSPTSPIGSYLIEVPSLPSPDLSELLETVPHYPQTAPHEERFVPTRPLADIPPRLFPRRRSPSPAPPPLPPVSAVPSRLQARARAAERQPASSGRATSFEHIDPELFAPGPYRNTIQSLMRRREASPPPPPPSRPPTIPPFAFESGSEREGIPPTRRYRHIYADAFDGRETHHPPPPPPPPPPPRAENNEEPLPHSSFWRQREAGRRPALYVRNDWEHGTGASQFTPSSEDRHRPSPTAGSNNSDIHAFLTRHVRLEGARMDRIAEAAAAQMNEASTNANASRFHHAIEVLRDGGLSRRHQPSDRPSGPRSSGDGSRERPPAEWYVPNRRRMRARRMRPLGDYMVYVFPLLIGRIWFLTKGVAER